MKAEKFVKAATVAMAGCMALSSASLLAGCGKKGGKGKYDPEKDPVIFSTGELDGVFNPFFSTSAYDTEIAGMTQVGMLGSNENAEPTYGKDEAVMTLDLKQTMYDHEGKVTKEGSDAEKTVYEFLIKNGVKDSTGADITIKDVLFNVYAYLDPLYNGSSTMYSTKIIGLNDYRTGGYSQETLDSSARAKANGMMLTLVEYAKYKAGDDKHNYDGKDPDKQEEYVKQLYDYIDEMAEEDWTSAKGGVEDANTSYILVDIEEYKTNKISPRTYDITQPWEVFFINEGLARNVEVNGKYKTEDKAATETEEAQAPRFYTLLDEDYSLQLKDLSGDTLIEKQHEICMTAMNGFKSYSQVESMLFGSSVNTKMFDYFRSIALEELLAENTVTSIAGITTYELKAGEKFNDVTYAMKHDVLKIEIEGVDPKAIWNFAFTVAPMHYYSNAEQVALFDGENHFGIAKNSKKFRDEVLKDSTKIGLPVGAGVYLASKATGGKATTRSEFKSNNVVYFERNPYFYTLGLDSPTATENDLKKQNDNKASIHNAYIKYLRYQVIAASGVLDAMISGQIDYSSEINAKQTNIATLNSYKGQLDYVRQENNGYGYIGVNPKYVPDIEVRRLIMLAMDRDSITQNYYTNGLGSIIERSMPTGSWAYPKPHPSAYYTMESLIKYYKSVPEYETAAKRIEKNFNDGEYLETKYFIKDVLTQVLGYTVSGDCLSKKLADNKTYKLDYTFTIAGDTKDHPAYLMFTMAAQDLTDAGMKIKVKTDVNALSKLANGSLAVWAAAWSSSVDPDMYQVYHKYSQATSVNNWGYSSILSDTTDLYKKEREIINELSDYIDDGRSYLEPDDRAIYYELALDTVMELAVELPTYQRKNLLVYNSAKIDASSLTAEADITSYRGLIDKIWELKLK